MVTDECVKELEKNGCIVYK